MYLRKIALALFVIFGLTACATDPAKYDLRSPCVSSSSSINLDAPCERRLPLENENALGIIANS